VRGHEEAREDLERRVGEREVDLGLGVALGGVRVRVRASVEGEGGS